MKKSAAVIIAATALLMPVQLGAAAVAAAEPAPTAPTATTTTAPTRFTMPSVTGVTLTKAAEAITSLSTTTTFRINPVIRSGAQTDILSPGSWVVCRQSPAAGRNITARTNITLQVARPWNGC